MDVKGNIYSKSIRVTGALPFTNPLVSVLPADPHCTPFVSLYQSGILHVPDDRRRSDGRGSHFTGVCECRTFGAPVVASCHSPMRFTVPLWLHMRHFLYWLVWLAGWLAGRLVSFVRHGISTLPGIFRDTMLFSVLLLLWACVTGGQNSRGSALGGLRQRHNVVNMWFDKKNIVLE